MKKNIIFFDVETNGKIGSSVLSMSAIKVSYDFEKNSWEKVSEYDRFYFRNEGEAIDFGAINVNGLTDDVIAEKGKTWIIRLHLKKIWIHFIYIVRIQNILLLII